MIAEALDEVSTLLAAQEADPFRAGAYRRAAQIVRDLPSPLTTRGARGRATALTELPGIGARLARAIAELAETGHLGLLDRLRGHTDSEALLASVPGIGPTLAHRIHDKLGIETLEELAGAAHDGRLVRLNGFGPRRVRMVTSELRQRWHPRPPSPARPEPPIAEMLDVDRQYRDQAARGALVRIAPRRFNPKHEAWLPVLHLHRGERQYTALFSNTARAHLLGKTDDWVVLYIDEDDRERQATVVTETHGPLAGQRVLRGREAECAAYYDGRGSQK
jgi:ribosomal protein S13